MVKMLFTHSSIILLLNIASLTPVLTHPGDHYKNRVIGRYMVDLDMPKHIKPLPQNDHDPVFLNHENYPSDQVLKLIEANTDVHSFFSSDSIGIVPKIGNRDGNGEEEEPICRSKPLRIRPRKMEDIDEGIYRIITNVGKFGQTVVYEKCLGRKCYNANSRLNARCVQKYNTIKLLTANIERNVTEYKRFRIPSTCVCVIQTLMEILNDY